MPAILDNDYVIASAYIARGYSKLVIDRNISGAFQDVLDGLKKAGLQEVINGILAGVKNHVEYGRPPVA